VGYLPLSMDSGICTPGAQNIDLFLGDFGKRLFKNTLDRSSVRLALPAVEIYSIVGNYKLIIEHYEVRGK
jgi:hypothetical protein